MAVCVSITIKQYQRAILHTRRRYSLSVTLWLDYNTLNSVTSIHKVTAVSILRVKDKGSRFIHNVCNHRVAMVS
jgi:hypothetical protein